MTARPRVSNGIKRNVEVDENAEEWSGRHVLNFCEEADLCNL
jgi:hypothetical protein